MPRIRQVRRDDGTVVPFRERKIADAVREALRIEGADDPDLADELAGAVVLFLEKYHNEAVPALRDVEDMLSRVLRDTGHGRAAAVLEELQERRRKLKEELTVRPKHDFDPSSATSAASAIEGRPWDRGRLVRDLVRDRELPESLAEEIALAVEKRLIRSELRNVTTALVAEIADGEVRERGLDLPDPRGKEDHLHRASLRRFLRGEGIDTLPDRAIAGALLTRFALEEIHGPATRTAHQNGQIHVHALDDPLPVERVVLPAEFLVAAPPAGLVEVLLGIRAHLDALRPHVREAIVLFDLVEHLGRHPAVAADAFSAAAGLVRALDFRDAYGRRTGSSPRLAMALFEPEGHGSESSGEFSAALMSRLLSDPSAAGIGLDLELGPGLIPASEDARLHGILNAASRRPRTGLVVHRPPEDHRTGRRGTSTLVVSLARISVNLPLLVAEARADDFQGVLKALEEVSRGILQAFTERFWHQRSGSVQGLHAIVEHLGGPRQVAVPAQAQEVDLDLFCLGHAVEILVRRGLVRESDRPLAAARILACLDYGVGDEQGGVRFTVRIGGVRDRSIRRRFLDILEVSARRFGFEDVLAVLHELEGDRNVLPVSIPLASPENAALIEAPFAERLSHGLVLPLSALGEGSPSFLLTKLRDQTRLGLVTLGESQDGTSIFEVQEELF